MPGQSARDLWWTSGIGTGLYRSTSVFRPIPVAVRSKACVCGHWLAGIVGSNPAGSMDVCLL